MKTLLLILLLSTSVYAEEPWYAHVALAAAATAQAADLSTTSYCLGQGTCHELNPVLRPFEHQPLMFGVVKTGMFVGLDLLTWKFHKDHPRIAALIWTAE